MSFKGILKGMVSHYTRLNKTEAKIFDTLVSSESGHAYGLWKASGLKHYPTVLRTLKKLEEKRLVQALVERGTRGEKIYTPTIAGILSYYIFNEDEKRILNMVAENSRLFREFSEIEKTDDLAFFVVQDILFDVYRKREPRSIDQVVKERLEDDLRGHLFSVLDEDSRRWIMNVSKVESMRELVVKEIEISIDWCNKEVEILKQLKETLRVK